MQSAVGVTPTQPTEKPASGKPGLRLGFDYFIDDKGYPRELDRNGFYLDDKGVSRKYKRAKYIEDETYGGLIKDAIDHVWNNKRHLLVEMANQLGQDELMGDVLERAQHYLPADRPELPRDRAIDGPPGFIAADWAIVEPQQDYYAREHDMAAAIPMARVEEDRSYQDRYPPRLQRDYIPPLQGMGPDVGDRHERPMHQSGARDRAAHKRWNAPGINLSFY